MADPNNPQEEEDREDEPETAPVETEDGEEEEATPAEQDIDFDKELEALEESQGSSEAPVQPVAPTGKTEEEKAAFTIRESIKRLQKKGHTPEQIFALTGVRIEEGEEPDGPEATAPGYVTRDELDIRDARAQAATLARSESELKVIMWYVTNKKLSVADAHFLANKGRVRAANGEIQRANDARPALPLNGSIPQERAVAPRFSKDEMELFQRRGMSWNPKTKQMEGKFTFVRIDPKSGERISGRLKK